MVLPVPAVPAAGNDTVTFLLTANLNGRFMTATADPNTQDPMLIMAQSLIAERKKRHAALYLDLGNAFYPGALSRFSWGSVMMDYLDDFGCSATLVSAQDLKIGIGNLEFIRKDKKTRLLSANIAKKGSPVFTPCFTRTIGGKTFAFIGISSKKGFFDIAETEILGLSLINADAAVSSAIAALGRQKVDHIILLSGLPTADNLLLMARHKSVSLCIGGGDTAGETYSVKASRIDLESGRSLINLTRSDGYYILSFTAGDSIVVNFLKWIKPAYHPTTDPAYTQFVQRLSLWQKRFAAEGEEKVATNLTQKIYIDDEKVANLLRDRFNAEIAIVESNSIMPRVLANEVTYSDIIRMVRNEYPIFTFKLSGKDLKAVAENARGLVITGTDGENVQGYPIDRNRKYLVCATQSVYDRIRDQLNREIRYKNSWRTLSDEIRTDLKGRRVLTRNDFAYLDNRFRVLADIWLSNFYDQSIIDGGSNPDIPPGMPTKTYHKWGIEDKIDITVYNRYHKVIFTPYIFYIRQDNEYLQNLLRGTLFYTYNLSPIVKPYYKSQIDTVLVEVYDKRPVLLRNTAGAFFDFPHFSGKIGIGVEKRTQDPRKPLFTGVETIFDVNYDILRYLIYRFHMDSFYSIRRADIDKHQFSANITNAFSFRLNSFAAFSIQHKWFYYSSLQNSNKYQDSQILMSLDLNTGFKFF